MRLTHLRLKNFQCFGPDPATLTFDDLTFLLGPNASGKTACLQALSRLFSVNPNPRKVRSSDFHAPVAGEAATNLFIEANFEFGETSNTNPSPAVADHYDHMRLVTDDSPPQVRFRLQAEIAEDGVADSILLYVLEVDDDDEPLKTLEVGRLDRNRIHVHYMPAKRDPSDHISYGQSTLLGRVLRAANWQEERGAVQQFAEDMNDAVVKNDSIRGIRDSLTAAWSRLHRGSFFASPSLSFIGNDLESLLQYVSVGFGPAHGEDSVDYGRLSDGQQSLLYLSLVLSVHELNQKIIAGQYGTVDVNKLRPPTFTMIVMEEPENSLSPHSLGRVIKSLQTFARGREAQAVVATHSPAMLKRVAPESVRHLRLTGERNTCVRKILLPPDNDVAYKYVRQAVQAYPELYFARLVILGEGDTEEIVIPRILEATGLADDESSITVAPLGGRHVNHFWRLLNDLDIPHITLLDLDSGRYGAGWDRLSYALKELEKYRGGLGVEEPEISDVPRWNDADSVTESWLGRALIDLLEYHGVYFSEPLDLDFAMLSSFGDHYESRAALEQPKTDLIKAVLGKAGDSSATHYADGSQQLFGKYHDLFQLGSKPTSHLAALATLTDHEVRGRTPASIARMLRHVKSALDELPE